MTLLTIREASRLIARTPATVRRYIRSGRLKAEKEIGKFGEEYKIRRDDLLALGFTTHDDPAGNLPVPRAIAVPISVTAREAPPELTVPASLYSELLMKHEQILVQYGMIRAGGQKLLEYKADAEAKDVALSAADERYQALRVRAAREIRFLRTHLRQAEIEVEDRNVEIVLLQEKIRRLERAAAGAAADDSLEKKVVEIRQKEQAIARLEAGAGEPAADQAMTWFDHYPPAEGGEDH